MSDSSELSSTPPQKQLPDHPSDEHLRKQAKQLVKQNPALHLAEAQHQIAGEYGCKNWAELMQLVEAKNTPQVPTPQDKLNAAILRGDMTAVKEILAADPTGTRVRRYSTKGIAPLHVAAWAGPLEMVEFLLRNGAKEWNGDRRGVKPLEYARHGQSADKLAIIELLDRPVIRDPNFKAAVQAIHAGDLTGLQEILNSHPALACESAMEPDCYPPSYFSNPKLVWFVANNPTLVKVMPSNIADIAEVIINAGALTEDLTYTLELAMSSGPSLHPAVLYPLMKVLLDHGAYPGDMLGTLGHRVTAPVEFVLDRGFPLTPAVAAGLGRDAQLSKLLSTASPEEATVALGMAVINHQMEAARLCLGAGADVNSFLPIHSHSLPTHQAAVDNNIPMLKLLIENGGRLDVQDTLWNGTPLNWAVHTGQAEAADYLRSIGAP